MIAIAEEHGVPGWSFEATTMPLIAATGGGPFKISLGRFNSPGGFPSECPRSTCCGHSASQSLSYA